MLVLLVLWPLFASCGDPLADCVERVQHQVHIQEQDGWVRASLIDRQLENCLEAQ